MGFKELVDEYCFQLRRRHFQGSLAAAKRTVEFLRTLISQKQPDAQVLIEEVRDIGVKMQMAMPTEMAIGNATRRILHMIREEIALEEEELGNEHGKSSGPSTMVGATQPGDATNYPAFSSLRSLLDLVYFRDVAAASESSLSPSSHALEKTGKKKKRVSWKRKDMVLESINEYLDELEGIPNQIATQSLDHIHAHEVVLTIGYSKTTLLFLEYASKKRLDLRVVVAEGAPKLDGHMMAKKLSEAGIQTTVITDAAIFAMMARVNQVFIGCKTLLANGGVIAESGAHLVALAAKQHAVPVVVLVGLHKLTPFYPSDPSITLNDFRAASEVADFEILAEGQIGAKTESDRDCDDTQKVDVINPAYDYVPGDLVSLFITDQGGVTPSYVYRLLDECYAREDYVLSDELEDLLSN